MLNKILDLIYCHTVKDKNGRRIKHGSVIRIHNPRLAKPDDLLQVRSQYIPEENYLGKILVIYNPNCCRSCRDGWSYIWNILELNPKEIEVVDEVIELKPYEEL